MAIEMFQIDAFATDLFKGNPAAVIKRDHFLPDALMQQIAAENNLSETAYVVPRSSPHHYDLRWFTPTLEIKFCGHATIATAHTLYLEYQLAPPFHFHTQIGELIVDVKDGLYSLSAPIFPNQPTDITNDMKSAFPVPLDSAFYSSDNLFVVFKNEQDIRHLTPNMTLIEPLSDHGVGITAQGSKPYDCVSRFFVPAQGIDEDPVTGSAHASLGPYWANQLGKSNLTAYQASDRGGVLHLEVGSTHLIISGHAITYLKGQIRL